MARAAASARPAATTRASAAARAAISSYRIPVAFSDLGITHLWDFRTGYEGIKSKNIADMMGGANMNWRGGTAIGTALTTGRYEVDLERTTANDYLMTGPRVLTNDMTSLTVFAWVKLESAVGGQIRNILTHWESGTGNFRGFVFQVNDLHNIELFLSSDGSLANQAGYVTAETLTDTSAYHLIVASYDTTNRGQIYLDKVAQTVSLGVGSHPASINSSDVSVMIGANVPSSPANFFDGRIGVCGIAENKAMSLAEITQLHNLTNSIGSYV